MVRSLGLIGLALLLVRCAQVGVLTGGIKDTTAPRIIYSSPANFTKQISPQELSITFDEFVQLNATVGLRTSKKITVQLGCNNMLNYKDPINMPNFFGRSGFIAINYSIKQSTEK